MKVGTRELKNKLSYYLRRVVAELKPAKAPADTPSLRAALLAMAARGDLTMGTGRFRKAKPAKLKGSISLSRRVLDDRR